jgi:hypothetical protein
MVSRDPALPSPTIRRANDADVETMTELARTAYAKYVERIGREPEPMTDDYATVVHENEVWLAEEDGNLVGMLVLPAADSHVLLKNVAVAPGAQSWVPASCCSTWLTSGHSSKDLRRSDNMPTLS